MSTAGRLDCVVIGYNEIPFERYEGFLRNYGVDTEAYRDLKFSFVDLDGNKLDYVGLMNYLSNSADQHGHEVPVRQEFRSGDIPNLAAVYLTNFLRQRGFEAQYINLFQQEKGLLIEYLDRNPLCVAITTTLYVVNAPVIEMVEFIRDHDSKVKIVVGGPLVANHARNNQGPALQAVLDDMGADIYVIEGQGELTLSHIIDCLNRRGDLSKVPNIAFFQNGYLQRTGVVPENNSLDENYIDWRRLPNKDLGSTIQTRTARSCAFNCSFCNYPVRAGKLTLASLETIERELDSMRELGNIKNVVFIDDTFNVPLPRFKDICKMIIKNDYRLNWFSYFRCSNSDEEAIELMARSGCCGVFLGIESGSPTILKNMNKAATIEKYIDGIKLLRQHGILTFGSFIIGFPGETDVTVDETSAFLREARPDYYRAQLWYCEPGTPIDSQRVKYHINGEGFVWDHATMDSLTAMDHIDRLFLTTKDSIWLPQWSFDFWIIPYLLSKGITIEQFLEFMVQAQKLLAMEIAYIPEHEKSARQQEYMLGLIRLAKQWPRSA
jgi:radical SAM PhpK family P-methyltransferase